MSSDSEQAQFDALGYSGYAHGEPGDAGAVLDLADGLFFEFRDWYELVYSDGGAAQATPVPNGRMCSVNRKRFIQWREDASVRDMHAALLAEAASFYGGLVAAVQAAQGAFDAGAA